MVTEVKKRAWTGTSLVVQWVRLLAPNAEGLGSIPGQGTVIDSTCHSEDRRSRVPKLRLGSVK